jgi:hypothetical protein
VQMDSCSWDLESALNIYFSSSSAAPKISSGSPDNQRPEDEQLTVPGNENSDQIGPQIVRAEQLSEYQNIDAGTEGFFPLRGSRNLSRSDADMGNSIFERSSSASLSSIRAARLRSVDDRIDFKKQRLSSTHDSQSKITMEKEAQILNDRILRFEQDEAYELSLAEDRAKDELRRLEELRKM